MPNLTTVEVNPVARFDSDRVYRFVVAAELRPLAIVAEQIAQTARVSIVGARHKSYSDLTPAQQRMFNRTGSLPFESSQPGKPPVAHSRGLPESIVGAVDAMQQAAVIGPTGRPDIHRRLEFGGTANLFGREYPVKPRPFMWPAVQQNLSSILRPFEGMLEHNN